MQHLRERRAVGEGFFDEVEEARVVEEHLREHLLEHVHADRQVGEGLDDVAVDALDTLRQPERRGVEGRVEGRGAQGRGGRGGGNGVRREAGRGCCTLVIRPSQCVDEFGTRRMLHEELVFVERDLTRLEAEAAAPPSHSNPPTTSDAPVREVVTLSTVAGKLNHSHASSMPDALLAALTSTARILVADFHGVGFALPSTRELEQAALKSAAFQRLSAGEAGDGTGGRGMPHAKRCAKTLAAYDGLVEQAGQLRAAAHG